MSEHPQPDRSTREQSVLEDVRALAVGLKTTLGELLQPVVTVQYPEQKSVRSERYRGRHYLRRWDNNLERCIGCELCAASCPVGCILVIAAENTEEHRVSLGERHAKVYEINMLRCIFCGYCEDACPVQAIVLGPEYELADVSRERFIYTKDMLIEPPLAQQEPLRAGYQPAEPTSRRREVGNTSEPASDLGYGRRG